jgi:uncharacterized protein YjbJ (UPF0337 family)
MSAVDKAKNAAEKASDRAKEATGKLTSNDSLRAEGEKDQTKGNLKDAGEKARTNPPYGA